MSAGLALSLSPAAPQAPATFRSRVVAAAPVALTPPGGATGANQSRAVFGDGVAGQTLTAALPIAAGATSLLAGQTLTLSLARIEERRVQTGVGIEALCTTAGVASRSYRRWRAEGRTPSRPVLQRLDTALARRATGEAADAAQAALIEATLGGFRVAARAALDVLRGAFAGPREKRRRDDLAGAVALYCANQFVGLRQATLAAHRGLSRAGAHLAIRRVEALRDADPAFDAAVAALGRDISRQND